MTEKKIQTLFKWGIFISCCLFVLGGSLLLWKEGNIPIHYHIFLGEPQELTGIKSICFAAFKGEAAALIQLGVLFLILIPITRVLLCAFLFLREKNIPYFLISLFTGIILLGCFFGLLR